MREFEADENGTNPLDRIYDKAAPLCHRFGALPLDVLRVACRLREDFFSAAMQTWTDVGVFEIVDGCVKLLIKDDNFLN